MKKFILALTVVIVPLFSAIAQADFAVSKIPPALLIGANAVVRQYGHSFEALDQGEAVEIEHKAITLLNERAEGYSDFPFVYDKIREIVDLEGAVYDAAGKLVRRIRKKDIADVKAYSRDVNDNRVKLLTFPRISFPFTIEYTVKKRWHGLMHYPVFAPQQSPSEAVESADFWVKMPAGLAVRTHENGLAKPGKVGENHWSFKNIAAFEPEAFAPEGSADGPEVHCAPTDFSLEGHDGNMETWLDYGLFMNKLAENRRKLSPATVEMLQNLVADCPGPACKTERVYHYLQQNTRYFFIGLGIGGWQPAPAEDVDALKYGDCKGLSNYMVAMLDAVGVVARYVVIRAGGRERAQFPDFPNAHFNHIVTCVPIDGDTIWLECTSQTAPFGFLGDFTDDRPALLVAPDGGHLVRTPKFDETANRTVRITKVFLSENGGAKLVSYQDFRGLAQSFPAQLSEFGPDFQKKYFYEQLNISDFEIDTLKFHRLKNAMSMNLDLTLPAFAAATGQRMFLPISVFSKMEKPAIADAPRRSKVQADPRGFTQQDVVKFVPPPGFAPESLPEGIDLTGDFGSFDLKIYMDGAEAHVSRTLVLNNKILPAERFGDLVDFLKKVATADRMKVVLVKG